MRGFGAPMEKSMLLLLESKQPLRFLSAAVVWSAGVDRSRTFEAVRAAVADEVAMEPTRGKAGPRWHVARSAILPAVARSAQSFPWRRARASAIVPPVPAASWTR